MTATRSRWLLCRRRRPGAASRLYCFPHSGGAAGEYVRWSDALPGTEVWGVQPPGRGGRLAEPAFDSMAALVEAVVGEAAFEPPYTLFGHSLGALVAYETALLLRERGLPAPERLILSAYGSPYLHRPGEPVHELGDTALMEAVERAYGPLPDAVREDAELRSLVLGGLRADLAIVATYRPAPAVPLDIPITVVGGADDAESPERLVAWHGLTTGPFDLRLFPGGHFYFRERSDELMRFLAERA
ncbi:thioesterase II family protein [Nonomuraea soli]|uniref:Surfactin synthase thioesterase subunit n=1 Tax=Nonomuraea soli TaxID=1032476 RepID=A0A7W0CG14_9ACTN|nr:alpha/beta fold hydrolase [Nonomuraea soli]MBA2890339.1 surfactin synthase thioesterase subunit [Nonomuraea soli]